jgi:DeoR/GlpR family transcriptional regulator of sugar metabolism
MSTLLEPLFVAERRRAILDQLRQNGRVSVKALSDLMNVSTVTIRHDLRALEDDGLLERTYGGAVRRQVDGSFPPELSFAVRNTRNAEAKAAIGAAAAALVQEDFSIALDASTTAYALVPYLKNLTRITIVTNNLIIAQSFLDNPSIEVLIPGGRLRKDSVSIVGHPDGLPDINLNIGFFGARGVSIQGGISDIDPDEVAMKQAMISRCVTTVIIADSSKWGQVAPYTVIPSKQADHIITAGEGLPIDLVEQFRRQGVQVDIVPPQKD